NMSVVLAKTANTCQAVHGSAALKSMEPTKIRYTPRKIPIRPMIQTVEDTMPWAVHWLHRKITLVHLRKIHIFHVVIDVTGSLIKLYVVYLRSNDFAVTVFKILFANKID